MSALGQYAGRGCVSAINMRPHDDPCLFAQANNLTRQTERLITWLEASLPSASAGLASDIRRLVGNPPASTRNIVIDCILARVESQLPSTHDQMIAASPIRLPIDGAPHESLRIQLAALGAERCGYLLLSRGVRGQGDYAYDCGSGRLFYVREEAPSPVLHGRSIEWEDVDSGSEEGMFLLANPVSGLLGMTQSGGVSRRCRSVLVDEGLTILEPDNGYRWLELGSVLPLGIRSITFSGGVSDHILATSNLVRKHANLLAYLGADPVPMRMPAGLTRCAGLRGEKRVPQRVLYLAPPSDRVAIVGGYYGCIDDVAEVARKAFLKAGGEMAIAKAISWVESASAILAGTCTDHADGNSLVGVDSTRRQAVGSEMSKHRLASAVSYCIQAGLSMDDTAAMFRGDEGIEASRQWRSLQRDGRIAPHRDASQRDSLRADLLSHGVAAVVARRASGNRRLRDWTQRNSTGYVTSASSWCVRGAMAWFASAWGHSTQALRDCGLSPEEILHVIQMTIAAIDAGLPPGALSQAIAARYQVLAPKTLHEFARAELAQLLDPEQAARWMLLIRDIRREEGSDPRAWSMVASGDLNKLETRFGLCGERRFGVGLLEVARVVKTLHLASPDVPIAAQAVRRALPRRGRPSLRTVRRHLTRLMLTVEPGRGARWTITATTQSLLHELDCRGMIQPQPTTARKTREHSAVAKPQKRYRLVHAPVITPGISVVRGSNPLSVALPPQEMWTIVAAVVEVTRFGQLRMRGWLCDERLTSKDWWRQPVSCDVVIGRGLGRHLRAASGWQLGRVYQIEQTWVVGNSYWSTEEGQIHAGFRILLAQPVTWVNEEAADQFRLWGAAEFCRARAAAMCRWRVASK